MPKDKGKTGKIKNPCTICRKSVKTKNGLQCQGACQKWVHYACLHFTPGNVTDVKKGYLKIPCPCPDCNGQADDIHNIICSQSPSATSNHQKPTQTCMKPPCCDIQQKETFRKAKEKGPPRDLCDNSSEEDIICLKKKDFFVGTPVSERETKKSKPPQPNLEELCNTVAKLSCNMQNLMQQMQKMVSERGGDENGSQKSLCPKVCLCSKKRSSR